MYTYVLLLKFYPTAVVAASEIWLWLQNLMGRPINVMFKEENAKKNESSAPKEDVSVVESSEQSDS